jgi:hypothetical protein
MRPAHRLRAHEALRTPRPRSSSIADATDPPLAVSWQSKSTEQTAIPEGPLHRWLFSRHLDPRLGYIHSYPLEASQEGNELFGIVGGEDPADLHVPQLR